MCDCWPFCAYVVGPRLQDKIKDIGLEMEGQLTKLSELTEQDDLETKYKAVFGSIETVCSNYKEMKSLCEERLRAAKPKKAKATAPAGDTY